MYKELLTQVADLSDFEKLESSDDMQRALEKISALVKEKLATADDTVVLSKKEFDHYDACEQKLYALEGAGVDNWSGYDHAMEILRETYNTEAAEDLSDE